MLCNKCKTNPPFEDDSWCLSCSGWESIGQDLCARWDIPALRDLACEAVVATARQLKSLRRLSSGLAAQQASTASALGGRDKGRRGALEELNKAEEPKTEVKEREPLPRSRSSGVRPVEVKPEKEPSSEYERSEDEDEDEESEACPGASRLAFAPGSRSGSNRPPEPEIPPREDQRGPRARETEKEHRERDRHHREHRDEGEPRRRKRRRAGRKHKNLARLVDNPNARVHRSLDQSFGTKRPRDEKGFARHT